MSDLCVEVDCESEAHTRQLCRRHYLRVWRAERAERGAVCAFEGCGGGIAAKGYCNGHYDLLRSGKPLRPLRRRRVAKASPVVDGKKLCTACETWLPVEKFAKAGSGYRPTCSRCDTLSKYGLNRLEFEALAQDGCNVCGYPDGLVVDHDHNCCPGQRTCGKCVSGVLCQFCNRALGLTHESPDRLRALARYAERKAKKEN